jgi:hypothetical protein
MMLPLPAGPGTSAPQYGSRVCSKRCQPSGVVVADVEAPAGSRSRWPVAVPAHVGFAAGAPGRTRCGSIRLSARHRAIEVSSVHSPGRQAERLAVLPRAAGRLHQPRLPPGRARASAASAWRPTDLVNARALLVRSRKTMELIARPARRPAAGRADLRGRARRDARTRPSGWRSYGVASVDINMGCPVHKVTRGGGGSAMMCDHRPHGRPGARRGRGGAHPGDGQDAAGLGRQQLTAPFFAREFEQAGVAAVTIHGRTREQGFGGTRQPRRHPGRWSRRSSASRSSATATCGRWPTPPGCCARPAAHGIAIGRGALLNPWFFAAGALGGDRRPGAAGDLRASGWTSWTGTSTCWWSTSGASASPA